MASAEDQVKSTKQAMVAKQDELVAAQADYAAALKIFNDYNETLNPVSLR